MFKLTFGSDITPYVLFVFTETVVANTTVSVDTINTCDVIPNCHKIVSQKFNETTKISFNRILNVKQFDCH